MDRQDWNMIGADCLVLSCCCQCLILQILVFVLLKLPKKLVTKTKKYLKRKFGNYQVQRKVNRCAAAVMGRQGSFRWGEMDGCMEEVEKVFDEMSKRGEFEFGSFWRGGDGNMEDDFPMCFVNQQVGCHDHGGKYHFSEVFGSLIIH